VDKYFSIFGKLVIAVLVIGVLIAGGFYLGKRFSSQPAPTPVPTTPASPLVSPVVSISALPTASPKSSPDDFSAIRAALVTKTGISQENIQVSVSQNTGQHAKGTVKDRNDVGGGYFLAAKVGETWIIVYDGQAQPTCSQINPYNFPKEMVPECLDSGGNVVTR
jgi:hypothetical protein